jgi:hypothetical protein
LDKNGHDHPIHFVSRQLISVKKNYIVIKQEDLVNIFFFEEMLPLLVEVQHQKCDK